MKNDIIFVVICIILGVSLYFTTKNAFRSYKKNIIIPNVTSIANVDNAIVEVARIRSRLDSIANEMERKKK